MIRSKRPATTMIASAFAVGGLLAITPAMAAPKPKVDLCHRTGNGSFNAISVNAEAVPAHLAHGDVQQPNGQVPGTPGYVFDSQCAVVSWDYQVNISPDPSAQDDNNLYVGSGIPATDFGTARNEALGIELGLGVLYRQGPNVSSSDSYADGELEFNVASGPQSTSNGSQTNAANRAAWNFTYSLATGLNGTLTNLTSHTFQLLYDVDPGPGTNYRVLTLVNRDGGGPGQLSGFQWQDQTTTVIADDEGVNPTVTQNSENYAFAQFQSFLTSAYGPSNSFAGPATFDIILQALDGTQILVRNHIVVNVAP